MVEDQNLGPNRHLIGKPGSRQRLATPAMVLDLDRFENNVATMARLCRDAGIEIRPHAKTHKSAAIAMRQVEAGAVGACCASLREAEALVAGGVPGVLVTSPVIGADKIARLIALGEQGEGVMAVVDNAVNAAELAAAARDAGTILRLLVDIDLGMHRTGVADVAGAVALAGQVSAAESLEYLGLQAYSGRVQHIDAYLARQAVYGRQLDGLREIVAQLREANLAPRIISGGGTGSSDIDRNRRLFTELQAGSYIFMDVEYNRVQIFHDTMSPFDTALYIQCTVVSDNAEGFVTIDGGFKCFATDGPAPEIAVGAPPGAAYEFFGDEHGRITFAAAGQRLGLGDVVQLVTPHCDPTVNLHDRYHCVRGDVLVDIWPVDGRGVL